jgi:hypothetical protein
MMFRQPGRRGPVDQAPDTEGRIEREAHEVFAGIGELQLQQVVGEVADIADIRKKVAHRHTNRTRRHFRVFQVRARSMSGDQQTHIDTVPYGIIQALTSVSRRRRL